jgi:hypothetical protein
MEQETIGPPQNGTLPGIGDKDVPTTVAQFVPSPGEDADQPDLILDGQIRLPNEKECVLPQGLAQCGLVGLGERRREIKAAYQRSDSLR